MFSIREAKIGTPVSKTRRAFRLSTGQFSQSNPVRSNPYLQSAKTGLNSFSHSEAGSTPYESTISATVMTSSFSTAALPRPTSKSWCCSRFIFSTSSIPIRRPVRHARRMTGWPPWRPVLTSTIHCATVAWGFLEKRPARVDCASERVSASCVLKWRA